MRKGVRKLRLHVISFITALGCAAQAAPQPGLILRSDTRVVQIDVVVTDSHGRSVGNLTKEDFRVTDEGKPRAIQLFSVNGVVRQTAPPGVRPNAPGVFSNRKTPPSELDHSTIILLDGANGWFDNFTWARQGVIGMLDQIPADEQIAIYAIAQRRGLAVVQNLTTDSRPASQGSKRLHPSGHAARAPRHGTAGPGNA